MPVTARFSKKFYDKLGEDIAQEMVDWFNQVDATYSSNLRDLNELNFARFDAKSEQRLAELDANWQARWAELDAKWQVRWSKLDSKIDSVNANLRTELHVFKAELIKWMFLFWLGTLTTVVALISFWH